MRLVGRTSLRIILSDVGERRLGPKRRRLARVRRGTLKRVPNLDPNEGPEGSILGVWRGSKISDK